MAEKGYYGFDGFRYSTFEEMEEANRMHIELKEAIKSNKSNELKIKLNKPVKKPYLEAIEPYLQKNHQVETLREKLESAGYVQVGEFNAGEQFPTNLISKTPAKLFFLESGLPGAELRFVDRAEFDTNFKPGRVYVVYRKG